VLVLVLELAVGAPEAAAGGDVFDRTSPQATVPIKSADAAKRRRERMSTYRQAERECDDNDGEREARRELEGGALEQE
jgi:hypothetical protein